MSHADTSPPRAAPRIGVVSGRYPASEFDAYVNHRAYCHRHGYTYIYCNWPTGEQNRYMNKLAYVRAYYDLFDYLFWIDDDAFFMDLESGLEAFLPTGEEFLSICQSPTNKAIHTYISSGQFVLRCDEVGRSFIDAVPQVDLAKVRDWWTQELGYFTGGDQDAMVYLLKEDHRFAHYAHHEFRAFNSRYEDLVSGDPVFVLHFTGTVPVKRSNYVLAQKRLARGPSLLPSAEAERWHLVDQAQGLRQRLRGAVERRIAGLLRGR